MASARKNKEALRLAMFAFFAGAHAVTEEVEKTQGLSVVGSRPEAADARRQMLEADYKRIHDMPQPIEMLADILNEEDLYPFGDEWPREALIEIGAKIIPPRLSIVEETDFKFRLRKGFKKILDGYASSLESFKQSSDSIDHWLTLLINTAFHAGMTVTARHAENSKAYYAAIQQIEEETEPWGKYPKIIDLLERQLSRESRRKTGLITDIEL